MTQHRHAIAIRTGPDSRPFVVQLYDRPGSGWMRAEAELDAAGVPVPLVHRSAWARAVGPHWLVSAAPPGGTCRAAFALQAKPTRAIPGHLVLRAERVGAAADAHALSAAMEGLVRLVVARPRVLRVEIGLFDRDAEARRKSREALRRLGLSPAGEPQTYTTTSSIELSGTEEDQLGRLHGTARRHIRAAARHPIAVRPIDDPRRAAEMRELIAETRRRTAGPTPERPLAEMIELANAHPSWIRVVGVFAEADTRLLAFAVGQCHGDHVCYADAASTRRTDLKLPLGYAPVWELIRWSRSIGARWFDFGGITTGSHEDADPLGGISDFKRYFRGDVLCVGEEWVFEPQPIKSAIADRVSRAANWARARMSHVSQLPNAVWR